jgi:hypothetical protein
MHFGFTAEELSQGPYTTWVTTERDETGDDGVNGFPLNGHTGAFSGAQLEKFNPSRTNNTEVQHSPNGQAE